MTASLAFPVEERSDGIWVGVKEPESHGETLMTQLVDRLVSSGVDAVFGIVGHSNLGLADALRGAEQRGELRVLRSTPRGRRCVCRIRMR